MNRDLSFNEHFFSLCKNAGKKVSKLGYQRLSIRLSNLMGCQQRNVLMKPLAEVQLGCYSLVWMFRGREPNRKINHIHEKLLRGV